MRVFLVVMLNVLFLAGCQSTATNSRVQALAPIGTTIVTQLLSETVASTLSISPQQASGAIETMLSLAKNTLASQKNSAELDSLIGSDFVGLDPAIRNTSDAENKLTSLGLTPNTMIQTAPIALQVLESQGATSTLLNDLSAIWL